jgi:uncharacterized membrane protein
VLAAQQGLEGRAMMTLLFIAYLAGAVKLTWDLACAIERGDPRLKRAGIVFAIACLVLWPLIGFVLAYDVWALRRKNVLTRRAM